MDSQEMGWLLKEKYDGEKSAAFFADCKRLSLGEPLGYLIGHVPFLDSIIHLDSRPLIPRPETEYWTKEAINTIKQVYSKQLGFENNPPHILDLCAGSGCIGVALLKAIPDAHVDFAEIDQKHLETIKKNLKENGVSTEHVSVVHSDLFSALPQRYDYILSNPPYIDETLDRVEESVVKHEPYVALFGGEKGLETIIKLITAAPEHLTPQGQLWLEHEPEQSAAINQLAAEVGFSISTHKDQYGTERYSILVLQ